MAGGAARGGTEGGASPKAKSSKSGEWQCFFPAKYIGQVMEHVEGLDSLDPGTYLVLR